MKVAIGSAFRNAAWNGQADRWFYQALGLRAALARDGHSLHAVMAEGDSADNTRDCLAGMLAGGLPGSLVDVSHGGPVFGSTEHPDRFKALQGVGNGILGATPADADALVYVESDLLWEPSEIVALLGRLGPGVDVVAPLVFAGEHFYDVFAFRNLAGDRFSPFPPYSDALAGGPFAEVSSAGSCLVMRGEVARSCRVDDKSGLVGFCADARAKNFRIWVDSDRTVRHPA